MRTIFVPVFVGIMRSTENSEQPITVVQNEPFTSGNSFDDYRWFRAEMPIRIQDAVTEHRLTAPEEVTENVFEKIGRS